MPVANRPILFHHLDALRQAGVLEATIAVEPETASAIRCAVGAGEDWGLRVDYTESSRALRIGEALRLTRDFVGDEPVLVQRVGALVHERIGPHIAAFADEHMDALALRLRSDTAHGGSAGGDGGWLLSERAIAILQQRRDGTDDFLGRVRDAGGDVRFRDVDGCELSHEDALLTANRRMLESIVPAVDPDCLERSEVDGPVIVHPTSRVEDSVIRGPAIIGPRTLLRRAYVGPYTSIGPDVTIEGAEIERSIVFAGAELRFIDARIETSIIGQRARVTRSFAVPKALRLSIGDGAEVSLS